MTENGILRSFLIVLVFCFVYVMLPTRSYAHRMLIDHIVEGKTVSIDVFFPDGKPAKSVKVEVYKPDETLYVSGETDAEGRFSFEPGDEVHLKVVATGKMGHRAEQEIYLDEATLGSPSARISGRRERGIQIPLREIFAGFGYILGVAGILMYLKARSSLKKASQLPPPNGHS
jgi:nickel transport protein